MLAYMQTYFENLTPQNILGVHIDSPVDMERTSPSFARGDLHGVADTTYQRGSWRPTPGPGQDTGPGGGRPFLRGQCQAPGGGVFGAGRATAIKAFEGLGLDSDKVASRR